MIIFELASLPAYEYIHVYISHNLKINYKVALYVLLKPVLMLRWKGKVVWS